MGHQVRGGVKPAQGQMQLRAVGESVFQPDWTAAGDLLFVSDRSDWWNLYRLAANELDDVSTRATALAPTSGEVGVPQWVFDQSRYAELADGRLLCAIAADGVTRICPISSEPPTPRGVASKLFAGPNTNANAIFRRASR